MTALGGRKKKCHPNYLVFSRVHTQLYALDKQELHTREADGGFQGEEKGAR